MSVVSRVTSLKLSTTSCGSEVSVICFTAARTCGLTSSTGEWPCCTSFSISPPTARLIDSIVAGGEADEEAAFGVLEAVAHLVLERRVERHHVELALLVAITGAELPRQAVADVLD